MVNWHTRKNKIDSRWWVGFVGRRILCVTLIRFINHTNTKQNIYWDDASNHRCDVIFMIYLVITCKINVQVSRQRIVCALLNERFLINVEINLQDLKLWKPTEWNVKFDYCWFVAHLGIISGSNLQCIPVKTSRINNISMGSVLKNFNPLLKRIRWSIMLTTLSPSPLSFSPLDGAL